MPVAADQEAELLAQVLLARKQVTKAEVESARADVITRGGRFATRLFANAAVDLPALAAGLAEVHGIAAAGPETLDALDDEIVKRLSAKTAVRALAFPVRREGAGVRVAFADPHDEGAIAAVKREIPGVRVAVAPELVVYVALVTRYGLARLPAVLEDLVEDLVERPKSRFKKRGPFPKKEISFVTTPGVLPSMPDEVSTIVQGDPDDITSPEDILWGDKLDETMRTLESEKDGARIVGALLGWAKTSGANAVVLAREGADYRGIGGAGDLLGMEGIVSPGAPSLLDAALAGDSGFSGTPPKTPGNTALLSRLGRAPLEVLALPLCRKKGRELVLWVDGGDRAIEEQARTRFRDLARLARRALE